MAQPWRSGRWKLVSAGMVDADWPNVTVVSGHPVEVVARLKEESGGYDCAPTAACQ